MVTASLVAGWWLVAAAVIGNGVRAASSQTNISITLNATRDEETRSGGLPTTVPPVSSEISGAPHKPARAATNHAFLPPPRAPREATNQTQPSEDTSDDVTLRESAPVKTTDNVTSPRSVSAEDIADPELGLSLKGRNDSIESRPSRTTQPEMASNGTATGAHPDSVTGAEVASGKDEAVGASTAPSINRTCPDGPAHGNTSAATNDNTPGTNRTCADGSPDGKTSAATNDVKTGLPGQNPAIVPKSKQNASESQPTPMEESKHNLNGTKPTSKLSNLIRQFEVAVPRNATSTSSFWKRMFVRPGPKVLKRAQKSQKRPRRRRTRYDGRTTIRLG
ncbi:uncharacterized protein LOC119094224 [Pollicipes pollicipes]|uniref:uncharacterized protein LOC119094224 n=1 Tax=Pollicipes pollicipes TaxID=41117 RepID=UPI0018853442|nr:uncharacterized protein LOC119094224 [Pollicipes pollicipes]